jgi:hypothetical protein
VTSLERLGTEKKKSKKKEKQKLPTTLPSAALQ